jgi:hypothetical protein
VNGTTFTQPAAINITGWSGNSSSETYLWNDYNGTLQLMLPSGAGVQTNITLSSNLNVGVYNVSCNSTGNSTLASKSFTVATTTTTIPPTTTPEDDGGDTTTTTIVNTTTTTSTITTATPVTTTEVTTVISETTTTTIQEQKKGIPSWYIVPIIIVFAVVAITVWYFKYSKRAEDAAFEQLKKKWNR